eukprot:766511-Hanusia_phi.AAC.3
MKRGLAEQEDEKKQGGRASIRGLITARAGAEAGDIKTRFEQHEQVQCQAKSLEWERKPERAAFKSE